MCDCFHLAFPNWHAASSGTGGGRRLRGPEPGTEDDSICDEPSQFAEGERPRPQGSSPVEEYPETEKYTDSDKECEAEHDPHHKSGSGKKTKKSGLGSMFEKRSTPKMSKLKEIPSPESGVIVKTAKDGCAEGLVYTGGGKDGIFIKEVVPESPASKSLKLKEGDQILSATVYFDNMSYEDAIQILEHAQAYKVKLCLKRKPDITETEPTIESDVIPEEEVYSPEMRQPGKTKRRGDARISWPKFPSFGKGRKSRFTRSHSSSEADEQRKLELSPTTSDTESPIKSQDALKGKKKSKGKLSLLTKRGRISSSEDQDTDTPTTGQISGKILQTHETSDMLSPEGLESPSGETPEVYVTEDLKVAEDLRLEQKDQKLTEPQTVQHKVELISVDSTLKTADLTVALADKESSTGIKSPDGKKKKKERSELKMKILGKDKSHKKDAKAKSSPKRLKTLGASIEIPDQPEKEKSDVIPGFESHTKVQDDQLALNANTQITVTTEKEIKVPKVELDIPDVELIRKSPQKGDKKHKKGKDITEKQETKTGPTFKVPNIDLSDIATEETVQRMNVNVEEYKTEFEHVTTKGTEMKEDPYEQLSKRTQLPKREEIEIPGMEDMSMRITAKGHKEPKAGFMGDYEELQAETVQLSIDVDSVKEAVSKLPGYKLPRLDTSGVPIPEEITVIDANAQRISVKTPTKVVDTKAKHEAHFSEFGITASPEISKTTVKLPKITPADLTSEELLIETKIDLKTPEKKYKTKSKQSDKGIKTELYKREDIIIPGKESAQDGAILLTQDTVGIKSEYESAAKLSPKKSDKISKKAKITTPSFGIAKPDIKIPDIGTDLLKQKGDIVKGERTILIQEEILSKTEARKGKGEIGGVISDVQIPEIDGIEYIDSVGSSPTKRDGDIGLKDFGINLDAAKTNADISIPDIRDEVKDVKAEEHTIKLPKFGADAVDISVNVSDADKSINIDGAEIKTLEREGKGSKFKMPNLDISMPKVKGPKIDLSLSKKDVDVTLPETEAVVKLPEVPEVDITIPEQRLEAGKPELEIKPLTAEGELDGQGDKFKMPKFGIKMPKIKGPELDLNLSKKDANVTLPHAKAVGKLPEAPDVDVTLGSVDVAIPQQKMEVKKPEGELDGQGSKFKMPKLGITMPKVKGPEIDLSSSKKDIDATLPEAKADAKLPDVELKEPSAGVEIKAPEIKVVTKATEGSPSKFKLPTFKLPKFGAGSPSASVEVPDMDKDVKIDGADIKVPEEVLTVEIAAPSIETEGPSIHMKTTGTEHEGKGSKFKMPSFGFSVPQVKRPDIDLSLSKKDVDVTANAEVKLPEAPKIDVHLGQADVSLPEEKIEVTIPELEMKRPQSEVELDSQGIKFKMPKVGMSMPKVKGPEIHFGLSKKDGDVTLPEAKAEVKVPEVEFKEPSAEVDIKAPEIKVAAKGTEGSPSKFKMPTFKLPKFGVGTPSVSVKVPDVDHDVKIDGADIKIPEEVLTVDITAPNADIGGPSIDIKTTETEQDGKESKFKMPHLGFSMPKVKGPKIDLSLSKKDIDVTLPEAKAHVTLPEVDISIPEAEMDIPEAKAEVKLTETPKIAMEIKPPECEAEMDDHGGKFKIPKFGIKMPKGKGPEFDLSLSKKEVDVNLPEIKADVKLPDAPKIDASLGKADVSIPEAKLEVEKPDLEIKPLQTEVDGQGSKFKMPKFGMAMPNIKGPEFHLGFSKKDVDVTLPEAKADVNLPDVELKEPSAKVEIKAPQFEVSIPETKVELKKPEVEITPLQTDVDLEGQGGKFKMPKFGITMPKIKGPEIDLSLSKKDVDVTLPEAKAEVELPEAPKIAMDMKVPETEAEIDGKGSKFKVPKFGISLPKVHGPEIDVSLSKKDVHVKLPKAEVKLPEAPDIDVNLEKVDVTIPEAKMEIKKPAVEIKPLQSEDEFDIQGGKFKMPKIGMSMPKVQGPEIDFSLSKKDVDVTLPEAKADIKLPDVELKEPSAKVDIKAPEIEAQLGSVKGSPSKFKMPTFKFPTFGGGTPKVSAEVPDIDKEIKIDGADMPHADVDVPKVKAEVHLPEVEVKEISGSVAIDQQPSVEVDAKMKKPRFSLPKFSFSKPSVKAPEVDVSLPDVNVAIPEGKVEVKGGEVDVKPPECEAEIDGQGSKFKMPKFDISMPKVKGPEIDLSLSKKDVDITLPEAKADVKLPDVELKEPSAEVEIKAPEIKVVTKDKEGSPSKFKMPTIKLPKIGVGSPSASVEVPDMDKDVKIDGADIKVPEEVLTVEIAAPSIETEGPSIHMKTTGIEHEGKGSKFKMPSLGFSVKQPDIDLSVSKKDVDVTLPEAKADVKLPDVELKESSAKVEIKAPEIDVQTGNVEGSPSKFKMPTFKLPKFGATSPQVSVEVPDVDKDIKVDGKDLKLPQTKAEVKLPDVEIKEPDGDAKLKKTRFSFPKFSFSKQSTKEPEVDVSVPDIDVSLPEGKVEVKQPEVELKPLDGDVEIDGKGSKFKMPKFDISMPKVKGPEIDLSLSKKDVDVTLPEAKADVNLPDVELKEPSAKVEIKAPQFEVVATGTEGSPSKFKMPNFGVSMPKVKGPDIHLSLSKKDADITLPGTETEVKLPGAPKIEASLGKAEVSIPEAKVELKKPEVEITPLQTDVDLEGQGGKFKMPKFGISLPKVHGPEIDVSLSKKDVHVKLPKAEVKLPEDPDINVNLEKVDVTIPEAKMEIKKSAVEIKPLQSEGELDIQGGKFKMPKIAMSMPKVQGPEIDFSLSKKDVDVTLPEAKADVKLPDVELKEPSAKVDIKAPEIEAQLGSVTGSPSKFKMPAFKFPTFGGGTPKVSAEVPDIDKEIKIDGADMPHADVDVPKIKAEVHLPEVEVKEISGSVAIDQQPSVEVDAKMKKPRFSLPKFSFSKPSVKAPEVDVSLPDVNVAIPEGKVEVKGGEVDVKPPECEAEIDGQGSKFKMPKFDISMPKVKGPEIDLSLSKKDVDITLPEAKADVKLPDVELKEPSAEVEIKAPEIKVVTKDKEGSPSKFKMPTFKLPKFGVGSPSASVEVPDMDKDVKIDGADIKVPEEVLTVEIAAPSIETEGPSIHMKTTGIEHEGKGSKFKMPSLGFSVKQPDIDLSVSKKDVDVTLPEAKADVKLPDVELKESSAKVEIKAPEIDVQTGNVEGSPSKFKMPTFKLPKFGATTPQVSVEVPDVDKDIKVDGKDLKLPQTKAEVKLPDVEIKEPDGDAKLKKTRFSFPKFSFSKPGINEPEVDVSVPDVDVSLPEGKVEVKQPEVELKPLEGNVEIDGQGSKFKMPKFGISMPKVKGPEIDLSLSKKDTDVTLPEAKAEIKVPDVKIKQPSAKVEVKAPETESQKGNVEGSPSKLKMPTFTLPKFGASTPKDSVEVPDVEKDIKIKGAAASIDTKGPSVDVKAKGGEVEGSGSIFKMPKFGISMPKVKGPEVDLSLSKKDANVTLPEAKAEIKVPDVKTKQSSAKVEIKAPEIEGQKGNVEGSPSKLKMPTFTLPKFGASTPKDSVEVPDVEKDIKIKGAAASIDTKGPSVDVKAKGGEVEGSGSIFKMPKFGISMPKVKGPEVDLSLSKKDANVTLPEAKAEIKVPDVKIKQPSAKVEVKAPEIEGQKGNVEGSPSKLKMPTFTLPKFGASTPKDSVEVPDVEKDIKIKGAAASIDTKGPSVDVKAKGGEVEGSGSIFKMPKFGISMPKVKGPEVDLSLSKKDVDVTLPEAKAEIKLPDVKTKQSSAKVEIKAPEIESQKGNVEGSPSKLKMPTFTLPKFGASTPKVSVEVPEVEKDIKIKGAAASIDTEGPSVDLKAKGGEVEGSGSIFKMPKFGISMPKVKGPEVDLSLSKKDADVTLPEAKAEIKQPSAKVEIKAPEMEAQTGNVEGSPSKLKMPSFTLPTFGVSAPKVSVEVPEVDKGIKLKGAKLEVSKVGAKVDVTAPSTGTEGLSVDVKAKGGEVEGSGSKFKMPNLGISVPKVKGPEIDLSLSKKDGDVTIPEAKAEVKLPSVQVKEPEGAISVPDAPTVEAGVKRPSWTFPKFSFSKTSGKAPDVDTSLETPKVDVTLPEAKAEISLQDVKVQEAPGAISMEEPPAVELDANLKKSKFSLFSFSKSSAKTPEVSAELPHVDASLPEGEVKVKKPEMEVKAPELGAEHDGQGGKFKLPKFGITLPKAEDSKASQKVDITLPEVKAEIKLPEVKLSPSVEIKASEVEAKSKDVGGLPLKVKTPTMKMPKFDATVEAPDAAKVAETDGAKCKEDATVNIKGPGADIKMDVSRAAITDAETPKTETDSAGLGSPSKFKLPLFKMPKLSFSKSKPEDEHVPDETECKEEQLTMEVEPKGESKSPKVTLTTFGEILKNIDVEFDVPKTEKEEENLETSKEAKETEKPSEKPLEPKEKETETKQETTKTPERTGWFKFPRFGLSSPSEPAKITEKDENKDAKSPVGGTVDDELSPTCSVQSSDAFADISSAMTSEHAGLSLSSPTKVTVKYSDPSTVTGLEETHSNIITSTTRTEMISVEPNLPEKITILSSGVSSSSEDTLRLESGKIHVITSNIQATPDTQHAKVLTAVQVQSSRGPPLKSETNEAASWTVEDSQSGKTTVFERHLVRETSTERSEGKDTIVITKKITHIVESSEPISGETASSIQRLRDTVHSEKMKFFDGDEE